MIFNIFTIVLLSTAALAQFNGQYSKQYDDGQYNPGQYDSGHYKAPQQQHYQPQQQQYQPQQQQYQPQPQQYQPPPQQHSNYQAPVSPKPYGAPPTGFLHDQGLDGTYKFAYQTKDGQTRAENTGADGAVRGSYTYTSPEGQTVKVSYTADKNGFHADSDAIPKAPIPAAAAPESQHYSAPQQHYSAPSPQQHYQAPSHHHSPPSYPQQSYDYTSQQAGGSYSGAPIAQYAYGDPKVVNGLQSLFG